MRNITCPNCGAANDVIADNQPCAFCGATLTLPKPKRPAKTETDSETLILPISDGIQTREGVIEAFKRYLVETDDIPLDIFDHLQIDSVGWYYLPFIRFRGQVTTNWSCTQIIYQKRIKEYRPVKDFKGNTIRQEAVFEQYEEYYPASGTGYSTIDIIVPCGNADGLSEAIRSLNSWRYINNPSFEDGCEAYAFGCSVRPSDAEVRPKTLAKTSHEVKSALDCAVTREGESVSYQNIQHYKDGQMHCTFAPDHGSDKCIFLPVVNIVYLYKGDRYEVAFIETICGNTASPTPHPVSDVDSVNNTVAKMKRSLKHWTFGSVISWILFEIVFFIGSINAFPHLWNVDGYVLLKAMFAPIIGVGIIYCVNGRQRSLTAKLVNSVSPLISHLGKLRRQLNLSEATGNEDYQMLKQEINDTESKVNSVFEALSRFKRRSIMIWILIPVFILIFSLISR